MDGADFLAFEQDDGLSSAGAGGGSTDGPRLLTNVPAPWLAGQFVDKKVAPLVRLHNEILSFVEYITPTVMEYKQRDMVLSEITQIIKSQWPQAQVKIFGSQMTRILTPTSDLDVKGVCIKPADGGLR